MCNLSLGSILRHNPLRHCIARMDAAENVTQPMILKQRKPQHATCLLRRPIFSFPPIDMYARRPPTPDLRSEIMRFLAAALSAYVFLMFVVSTAAADVSRATSRLEPRGEVDAAAVAEDDRPASFFPAPLPQR